MERDIAEDIHESHRIKNSSFCEKMSLRASKKLHGAKIQLDWLNRNLWIIWKTQYQIIIVMNVWDKRIVQKRSVKKQRKHYFEISSRVSCWWIVPFPQFWLRSCCRRSMALHNLLTEYPYGEISWQALSYVWILRQFLLHWVTSQTKKS